MVIVSAAVMRYCALMFFTPRKYVYETVINPPVSKTSQIADGIVLLPENTRSLRYSASLLTQLNDSAYNSLLGADVWSMLLKRFIRFLSVLRE